MDLLKLSCPSCGAKLEITPNIDRFACSSCGNEFIVQRAGGTVALMPILEGINQVKAGVDKTAAELAYNRIKEELTALNYQKIGFDNIRSGAGIWMIIGFLFAIFGLAWMILLGSNLIGVGIIFIGLGIWMTTNGQKRNKFAETQTAIINQKVSAKLEEIQVQKNIIDN